MRTALTDQIVAALTEFSSASRLYELKLGAAEDSSLLVEAFVADDALQEVGIRDVIVLSTDAHLALDTLLGEPAVLEACLADGTRARFAGEIVEVAMLGSDGGLARYRIRISSWLWQLGHARNSRVWQDNSVIDIVDAVFTAYLPVARWRWSIDTGPFMTDAPPRSYCCQYRESDLDFVRRLLTEEGLGWRLEQTEEGPGLVLFADSSQLSAVPEDASSASNMGIRFHGARSMEESDSIQSLCAQRRLHASLTTVLSSDYKAKQVIGASSPTRLDFGGKLPLLESFDAPGQYAYADRYQAQRHADIRMQGQEARGQLWRGRSTVRTLRAGTRLEVVGAPLRQFEQSATLTVLRVFSIGVNNMPPPAQHALTELFGPIPELLQDLVCVDAPEELGLAIAEARETGYANCFDALASDLVWRPDLASDARGTRAKPVAFGAQSAIVVGVDGGDQPIAGDELYCDRLGRIRIRFHWQDNGNATRWVRVAQRSANGGMGHQFLPRIGQEVMVQFLENDIDRPVVVGALYNGQGEGGVVPTPGGRRDNESDLSSFEAAHDHSSSAQANLAGGHSPVWHGASADSAGHRNPAAQWGIRSKESGGFGYCQLLFDDTDGQGRVQLKSTYAGSELNFGHLIHAGDNYRGSFRGLGAELRTDAYGTVRAGAGVLVSSYKVEHSAISRSPTGQNAAGIAMLRQATTLAQTFSKAAVTHQTVDFAVHLGTVQANASILDNKASPLKAMCTSVSVMVDSLSFDSANVDTNVRNIASSDKKLPYSADPIITIVANDGVALSAGQNVQLSNGETIALMSGQETQVVIGQQMRMHVGKSIGVLGGIFSAGNGEYSLQVITSKSAVNIQAQRDEFSMQSRDEMKFISSNAHIDWAAAKRITVSTNGGATITIEGGNIVVQCPGAIMVHAGKKSFIGPDSLEYPLPAFPNSVCKPCLLAALRAGSPLVAPGAA